MSDLEQNLRADLNIIKTNWADLLDLPRTPGGDKVDTSMASPTPVPVSVLSLRFDCSMLLASWAHLVWDEMHLTTGIDLLATIPICRFLNLHSNFLATHYAAKYAASEIGYYASAITELIAQTRAHQYAVGMCPDCEGTLTAYMQIAGAPLPSDLRCSLNPEHIWAQDRWRWLGDRISGESIRYEVAARRLAAMIGM